MRILPLWFAACDHGPAVPTDSTAPPRLVVAARPGAAWFSEVVSVDLAAPSAAWAVCTRTDDPTEQHLAKGDAAVHHDLVFRGLLPDTAYDCTVRAGDAAGEVSFTIGPAPETLPTFTVSGDGPISGAYTLFNSQAGCFNVAHWLLITDPEGRPRWAYDLGSAYILDIDAYLLDAETLHFGGGWGLMSDLAPNRGIYRDLTLDGEVLVERTVPDFGLGFNHHSEPLGDGSTVSLTGHLDTNGDRDWHGVGIEVWSPVDGVTWTWDSQALYDAGLLFTPAANDENLPYHANAVSLHTDALGDAAWVSNFGMEQIWRIDRATGARTHVFGVDGDFALTDGAGAPLGAEGFPSIQHGVDYDGDKMLVYDNGVDSGVSRVVEYRLDLTTLEAELLWSWTEPGWFDPIVGDADYLPNGDVLVTQGFVACLTPFAADQSELVELTPPNTVVWRQTWDDRSGAVYRAERYDGCDVFANAKYCPDVAAEIASLLGEPE